ncbi:MAG: hypothetical protein QJR01_00610 [Kyrpidia sp.]|nr:hypothetical protein [Kyrpidia sp.]
MASGILADVFMMVGAILLGTGWGHRRVARSPAGRRALVLGLGLAWCLNRFVIGIFGIRLNAGGLVLVALVVGVLFSSSPGIRAWFRQIGGMVVTASVMALVWAGLPYTPLAVWPFRDLICAGIGAVAAGLLAPSPLFAAACAGWGVVCGVYEVLVVQYNVSVPEVVWFDNDLLDDMTAAAWTALGVNLVMGGLMRYAQRRPAAGESP